MSEHTPWRVENVGPKPKEIWVCTIDMPPIFICECEDEGVAKEIMSSHNSHADLVEALRESKMYVCDLVEFSESRGLRNIGALAALDKIDALLERIKS